MKLKVAAAGLAASLFVSAASAATLNIGSIDSEFSGVVGGTSVSTTTAASGNSAVSWGTPHSSGNGLQSGYEMDVTGAPASVMDEEEFEIAEFTHNNEVINAGTSITQVSLDITLDLSVDFDDGSGFQDLGEETFSFVIDHNETPNNPSSGICEPNGSSRDGDPLNANGCADVVDISGVVGSNTVIVGEYEFTLNIIGFLDPDSGEFSQSFFSMEQNSNTRIILASFTVNRITTEVPLPASGLLLIGGLAGIGVLRRRRRI